ncbi:MAG: DUF2057 family protein [Marinobacter sp.]|uniref:DUF2057 family protein n=1 Tax=Marinobacter sp. TaxID=50741 RepID=UPI00299D753F|nr:DUF2057 family protein [Marinobacter sp.]MDX1634707.1 DUF2057 family protein [Marinobacter sp.]
MMSRWLLQSRHTFPAMTVVVLSMLLGACSSSLKRVQTWEGQAAQPGQVAVLKTPGDITVQSVNGREVGNFLMDDLALEYELLPGRNTIVFVHETIWAKKTVVRDGESKVHNVTSGPRQVVIDAKPGEVYTFDLPELSDRSEAEAYARNFNVAVTNESGRVVARSEVYQPQAPSLPTLPSAGNVADNSGSQQAPAPQAGAAATAPQGGERLPTVEALKLMWERASAEEKREFLRWAFE